MNELELQKDLEAQKAIYEQNTDYIEQLCRKYFEMGKKQQGVDCVNELKSIMAEVDQGAMAIEAEEDQRLASLVETRDEGPIKAEMVDAFMAIINEIDAKHTDLVKNVRNVRLKALFEKFAPEPSQV